jgi:hypothetical protein
MTGKRELWRARSSSAGVGDRAVAGVVLRDVGCPEELPSPVSSPVPASISKSGASPLAAVASKAFIGPLPRAVVGGNGTVVRVSSRACSLVRDGSHAKSWASHSSPRRPTRSSAASGCEVSRRMAPIRHLP